MDSPLASTPEEADAARLARLYVLTRDAYLSAPAVTTDKLTALDELRRWASRPVLQAAREAAVQAGISQVDDVRGVRLVEFIRVTMHDLTRRMNAERRAFAVVDVLVSTMPPTGFGWAASPVHLACEAAAYLAPELSSLQIHRIAKTHRASRRFLAAGARIGLPARALIEDPTGPEVAVAEMLAEVLGLGPAPARCAAIALIDGGSLPSRHGLCGGAILEPLSGFNYSDAFVGTALARAHPAALVHELASLECALKARPSAKPMTAAALEALREDLAAAQASSADEHVRLRAARRAVELAVLRMGAGERGRLSALATRRHLPRPGHVAPTTG